MSELYACTYAEKNVERDEHEGGDPDTRWCIFSERTFITSDTRRGPIDAIGAAYGLELDDLFIPAEGDGSFSCVGFNRMETAEGPVSTVLLAPRKGRGDAARPAAANPRPNGYVLWKGRSPHDDKPVVCVATGPTRPSKSPKTGAMLQVYLLRSRIEPTAAVASGGDRSVCNDCELRPYTVKRLSQEQGLRPGEKRRTPRAGGPSG